jgi:hypothetical protein
LAREKHKILNCPGLPVPVLFLKGHYIWLEGILNNMLHDMNLQAVVVRDVTERIEANKALKKRDVLLKLPRLHQD